MALSLLCPPFKVYCLLARHLQGIPDLASKDAGEILLSFMESHADENEWNRELKICIDGPHARLTADFAGVKQAPLIMEAFARALEGLTSAVEGLPSNQGLG